jgi:cation:H+ antiporter
LAPALKEWLESLIPFSGVLAGSMGIAWATEVAAFFLSRGLAFALLALLQVLPEFAVEAVITWEAAQQQTPEALGLVTANFTGANRLLVGMFLPIVFFVYAGMWGRSEESVNRIQLPMQTSLEVIGLLVPTVYSFLFAIRGSVTIWDAAILTSMYVGYLVLTYRLPPTEENEEKVHPIPRWVLQQAKRPRTLITTAMFLAGGLILFLSVEPFYHNTIEIAAALGLPAYILFQWIAPLLSESPELITVSYWARTQRAAHGVTNVLSSKINQWTILIAMLPIVYGLGLWASGDPTAPLPLADQQQVEVLLTAAQAIFAGACLLTLTFERWQAWALFGLWGVQVFDPVIDPVIAGAVPSPFPAGLASGALVREWFTLIYLVLAVAVIVKDRDRLSALPGIRRVWREHLKPGASGEP